MDFPVPADHRMKIKESEEIDKYLDLTREQKKKKKLRYMRARVIPIVVGALEIVPKGLEKNLEELEIRRRIEMI